MEAYDELMGLDLASLSMDGAMSKAPLGKKRARIERIAQRGRSEARWSEAAEFGWGLAVDGANRVDFEIARATFESLVVERPTPTQRAPQ